MTEMKCKQVLWNRGRLAALMRSLTSAVDMFPTTFDALSTTATLVSPSWNIRVRASAKGLSELFLLISIVCDREKDHQYIGRGLRT